MDKDLASSFLEKKSWDNRDMIKATRTVRNKASKEYNVPLSTLYDYFCNISDPSEAIQSKLGRKPISSLLVKRNWLNSCH